MAEVGQWTTDLPPSACGALGARSVVTGIFRTFDSRGDGMFSCAALANVLRALDTGAAMSDKEIDRLLKAIDIDHVGWIHYEAFCDCIFGSMAAPGGEITAGACGGVCLAAEHLAAEPPVAELLAAQPLVAACKEQAISWMTSSTIPPGEGESSRSISEELGEDDDGSVGVPFPSSRAANRNPSITGLNPLLVLELAAIDGDCDTGTPAVTTERIPRTPSTTGCLSGRMTERTASPTSRHSARSASRGPDSSRRPSMEPPATECGDGEITGCPSLAASMSSAAMTCPATSSTATPPWGCVESQATVAFVSCAQDPNEQFRSYMEDGQKIIDPFFVPADGQEGRWGFFAVYDGHGGRQAVDYCEERLHDVVLEELTSLSPDSDVSSALKAAFEKIDGELAMVGAWRTGCTATVALVYRTATTATLYVANVGDSRAVLYGKVGPRRISNDHKASDPAEAARIAEEGGMVRHGRVGGQLIVSRSLGDHHLKGCGVSCVPEVKQCNDVSSDRALVIASDGLWDGLQDEEVGGLVDRCVAKAVAQGGGEKAVADFLRETAAQDLVDGAKDRGSRDNILALVMFF